MNNEIKGILDKFDKVLENYELDKKWGQMSVDSICHLFPSEIVAIKDCITNLQEDLKGYKEELENLSRRCDTLEFQNAELERYFEPKAKEDYDLY